MACIHGNAVLPNYRTLADKHWESPQPPTHLGGRAWTTRTPTEPEGGIDGGGATFSVASKVKARLSLQTLTPLVCGQGLVTCSRQVAWWGDPY